MPMGKKNLNPQKASTTMASSAIVIRWSLERYSFILLLYFLE
jgi:hypothetical protein